MIINEDTRKTIKFIIWTIIVVIILYIASVFVFFKAGSLTRSNDRNIAAVANQKTPITKIQNYYHLDRGTNSYAINGIDKHGRRYYFIYLPDSKKAYLYPANKGISETAITNKFNKVNNYKIKEINLGWYQSKPVWEISYQKVNGNLGFNLYDFKTGKAINEVDNL